MTASFPQSFQDPPLARRRRRTARYAIIQDIRDRTSGGMVLTASTLYAAIKRMVDGG